MKLEKTRIHFFKDVFAARRRPRILRSLLFERWGDCMMHGPPEPSS